MKMIPVGAPTLTCYANMVRMSSVAFNTFCDHAEALWPISQRTGAVHKGQHIADSLQVDLNSITGILEKHFSASPLHLLCMDVEGMGINLNNRFHAISALGYLYGAMR